MLFGFYVNAALRLSFLHLLTVFAEWKLNCYDEELSINCEYGTKIVVHDAQFGFFEKSAARLALNNSCVFLQRGDCWTDVSTYISGRCSGQGFCKTNVHYSIGLSSAAITEACPSEISSKPSLFVEFDCISNTLFTKISPESHANFDQIGGYLTTLDYSESVHGGSEWRGHLAEAMCQPGEEQLPAHFFLPAPTPYGQQDAVTFVLRIKDISLTHPANHTDPTGAPAGGYALSAELDCLVRGKPCQQDYLEISAKLPSSSRPAPSGTGSTDNEVADPQSASDLLLPIARFCLVNRSISRNSNVGAAAAPGAHAAQTGSEYLFGHGSPLVVGRVYGPLPPAVGLQFTSNLNLLNADPYHMVPGKGILIEYIALFCTPISQPAGHGLVDYRFHSRPHSTVAYAEIFCPSDRWLEPQPPSERPLTGDEDMDGDTQHDADPSQPWWLERKRHRTFVCQHHMKSWAPSRIPAACLTDSELSAFVANVEMLMQKAESEKLTVANRSSAQAGPPESVDTPDHENRTVLLDTFTAIEDQHSTPTLENKRVSSPGISAPLVSSESKLRAGPSVAVGAALGFLICLLAVLLIVYSLRHKLVAHYHKTMSFQSMPHGLTRSSSTFNPSMHSYYPTVNSATADWRRKLGKSRWDFFRPWRAHTWSQNLSGTYPDLPRQTVLHGTMSTGQKTPETMVLRSGSMPFWPTPMPNSNGQSSFSLIPGAPPTLGADPAPPVPNGSPWLRTTSTTQLNHMHAQQHQQQPVYMNSLGELSTPIDGYPFNQPWWLPWRRSLKKQRRLYMHLQRRREVQYQSQRKLLESSASSNGLSSQLALAPSGTALLNSSCLDSLADQGRPLSQRTTRSSRTFTTSDGGTATPGCAEASSAATQHTALPPAQATQLGYTNWDVCNAMPAQSPCQAYQEVQPVADRQPSIGADTLPWKTTPPSNTFSNGLRRFSSFLRNLNGSLTPPRSSGRRSQSQLINQLHPQSMSTLDSAHYFQTSPVDAISQNTTGRSACFPVSPVSTGGAGAGFPRAKSESGSVRLGRGLGLRSLFNIPISRDGQGNASLYNLETEETSTSGDLLSGSTNTTATTKNSATRMMTMMMRPMPFSAGMRPEDWAAVYPDWVASGVSATSTIRGQAPFGYPSVSTYHPHHQPFAVQPTPTPQSVTQMGSLPSQPQPGSNAPVAQKSDVYGRRSGTENSHCNDPYLEPVMLKRLRMENADQPKPSPSSDSDAQPSATSSAISSLVFADSMVDDELEPERSSTSPVATTALAPPTAAIPLAVDRSRIPPPDQHQSGTASRASAGVSRGGLDYVTYDLTRSGNTLTTPAPHGCVGTPVKGELLATQLEVSGPNESNVSEPTPNRRPKPNPSPGDADAKSRPLSDAMISNHYYDANEFGVYRDIAAPVAPVPPPRVDLMLPRQTAPNLPPLWNNNHASQATVMGHSRPPGPDGRIEFGSTDSLYETVDQFHGLGTGAVELSRGRQAAPPAAWLAQDTVTQRQRMALPPTPGSMDSVRAPMATSDDVSDAE